MYESFISLCARICEYPTVKLYLSLSIAALNFFFGSVYQDGIFAIAVLILFDIITGVIASTKYEKKKITSRRLLDKVVHMFLYFAAISAAYFTDLTIPGSLLQSGTIAFIGGTEFLSIVENLGRMGFKFPSKILEPFKNE